MNCPPATSPTSHAFLETARQTPKQKTKPMKPIQIAFKFLTVLALAALAAGCAGHLQDKVNVAVAAGFKVITPSKPDQQDILRKLPADKVTRITYHEKIYYVLPDLKNNQAYVGGPAQYESYQRLRKAQLKNSENVEAAEDAAQGEPIDRMNWDEWRGWDGTGGPGWY
jgi:hypothetical protein